MNGKVVSTAQGAIFDFVGTLTPSDNFSGRNQDKYGIAEVINLNATISPAGITPAEVGGLQWAIDSGVGTLSAVTGGGTATFNAGDSAGAVQMRLEILSGSSQGAFKSLTKTIVVPSGGYMVQVPGTNIFHQQHTASAGFQGYSYILPKDVSFKNLEIREGSALASSSGFYSTQNGDPHAIGPWIPVASCDIATGCTDSTIDTVQSAPKGPPYSDGDFLWPIPWEYRVGTAAPISYFTANHHKTADAFGRCCMEKAGAGPFCKDAAEPSSTY